MNKVKTGITFLDEMLNGGFDNDIITTIYGPSGSGKTNICLIFSNYLASNNKKVLYIDTENSFSIERLSQINPKYMEILSRLIFLNPKNFYEQTKAIELIDTYFKEGISAIIIDSITMLYRLELGKNDIYEINRKLGRQLLRLSIIAKSRKIPVIITTQVYSDLNNDIRMVGGDILSYISKCILELKMPKKRIPNVRIIRLKKHRSLPEGITKQFIITSRGLFSYKKEDKNEMSFLRE